MHTAGLLIVAIHFINLQTALSNRIANLRNQFEEAPNVSDLKAILCTFAPGHVLGSEEMSRYLEQQDVTQQTENK